MTTETSTAPLDTATSNQDHIELLIEGMSCASCVGRIERALGGIDGVSEASVNLVTRKGSIDFDPSRTNESELIAAVKGAGYQATNASPPRKVEEAKPSEPLVVADDPEVREQEERSRDLKRALLLGVPVIIAGMSHGAIPWFETSGGRTLAMVLTTLLLVGPGARFFRLAWNAALHRTSDMNTLVAIGVGSAYVYSTVGVLVPSVFPHSEHGVLPHLYFEAAAAIVIFVLLGKWLETRARRRLADAVRGLVSLVPTNAFRVRNGQEDEVVSVDSLVVGDLVRVKPGERVATDGVVTSGTSTIDESMLTGESVPVDKKVGSQVVGGTLNQVGTVVFRVTRVGRDTALARIVAAVEDAQGSRAPIARLADRVSAIFVPTVLVIAALTGILWFAFSPDGSGIEVALERFVAVLVIACPCALGLATPAAVAVGTGRGAELGVLVKGGAVLEGASRIDTILFDKTGTLTRGTPELTDIVALHGDGSRLLRLAASLDTVSEHPLAKAIVDGAKARGLSLVSPTNVVLGAGAGIAGDVEGTRVIIGTETYLREHGVDASSLVALGEKADELATQGRTPSFVALDGVPEGLLALADRPSPGAREAVEAIKALGIEVAMVSGDRRATAEAIAAEVGISRVFAEARPEDKARIVAEERARGRVVAMVGDGINDAPALAAADVGIAIGSGTDIAIAAADISLIRGGIETLPVALGLARKTLGTIRENLFWAFVYNVVGIPIAAGLAYPTFGILLSPVFASAAMSLSSVSVLLNSLRLRGYAK